MFNGNKIYLIDKNGNKKQIPNFIIGLNIHFKGKNSSVTLYEPLPKFKKCKFKLNDNSHIEIHSSNKIIKKLNILMTSNQICKIGENFSTLSCECALGSEPELSIIIGNNCMFSKNILIRTSDGHSIVNSNSNQILNFGKDVHIGNNVWIAGNVAILKGAKIPNGSVIGHGSIVTNKLDEENSIYVGIPAQKVKTNICWYDESPETIDVLNSDIDIVYLWCDSNDEKFYKEKLKYEISSNDKEQGEKTCRYVSNDELKYALRSLEKYAPWINRIFIVTNNQIPHWLNINHPKINIIDHKEIIPAEVLPTFNSNAILHCIANIPNLSERFLYSDDDCFFAQSITKEFFFAKDGYPIFRYSGDHSKEKQNDYSQMLSNAENLLKEDFPKINTLRSHHNIDAYLKKDIKKCYQKYKSEIDKTIHRRFRTTDDIERIIYSKYACAISHGHKKVLPEHQNVLSRLLNLNWHKDSLAIFAQSRKVKEKLAKSDAKLFCLNDTENATDLDREHMKTVLEELFPNKSQFEK